VHQFLCKFEQKLILLGREIGLVSGEKTADIHGEHHGAVQVSRDVVFAGGVGHAETELLQGLVEDG